VEVPLEKAGGGSVGETPDRPDGDHPAHQKERDAAEAPKAAAEIKKEEKSMRKNAMCDMDCLNCTRPENRCYGGGKRGSMKVAKYHKMTDGKRGENMPDVAMGRGGKKSWH
jgi:hypothetical protein